MVTAKVNGASQLKSIRLRYRHLTQFEDYQSMPMVWDHQRDRFTAAIPGDFIVPNWDLMYFIEAADQQGRGWKVPDFEKEIPYVTVTVER